MSDLARNITIPAFFAYPPARPDDYVGFWGPVTATIDWCEENYIMSPYIAEFINSFTNFGFIVLAAMHIRSAIVNKHGPLYIFIGLGFASVGVGSFLFHMTLLYEYQLMDELPMVYVTALPTGYILGWGKPTFQRRLWWVGTGLTTALFTYIYIFVFRDPAFHQAFYALLNFIVIYKTTKFIRTSIPDASVRKYEYKMLILSFSLFAFGFFIWNCDNIFCPHLINARRNFLGLPLGVLTEGHGWWHIFTGLGIYYFIIYNQIMGTYMLNRADKYKVVWHGPLAEVKLVGDLEEEKPKMS